MCRITRRPATIIVCWVTARLLLTVHVDGIRFDCYDASGRVYYSDRPCSDRPSGALSSTPPVRRSTPSAAYALARDVPALSSLNRGAVSSAGATVGSNDDRVDGPAGDNRYGALSRRCVNGGRFVGAYCLVASDCAVAAGGGSGGALLDCVRAMCCTRTTVSSDQANVATAEDVRRCTRLTRFYMGARCQRSADCNRGDRDARDRDYGLFVCVNGQFCCSKLYNRPVRVGDGCVNGGQYTGVACPRNENSECSAAAVTGTPAAWDRRHPPICIDRLCCSNPPSATGNDFYDNDYGDDYRSRYNDDYGDDDDDDDDGIYEVDECANGGQDLGTLCTAHAQCGAVVTTGGGDRWTAVCSDGRCCTNVQNLRANGTPTPGQTTAEWRRGESACAATNGAIGGRYVGVLCTRSSDCGAHPLLELRCRSGFCCEFYDARRGRTAGGQSSAQRYDAICAYRGYDLGYACDYDPLSPRATIADYCGRSRSRMRQRNVCIRGRCCAVPRSGGRFRGDSSASNESDLRCRQYPFTRYVTASRSCTLDADCYADAAAAAAMRPHDVICSYGACCARSRGGRRYDPNAPDNGGGRGVSSRSAFCYDGTPSDVECRLAGECLPDESCVNNLCCPTRPDQRQYVCGGLATNGPCFPDGHCGNHLFCAATQLCCECRYGQPQPGVADCRQQGGMCGDGFYCNAGGFCCPRCASGNQPYGSCHLGRCARGFHCQPGNICCEDSSSVSNGIVDAGRRPIF